MSDYVRRVRAKVGHDLLFWPSVACLIRNEGGALLLVKHVEGRWTLPAGAMDPGESPGEAARRETREETSLEVELLRLAGVYGGYPDFHMFYSNGDEVAWITVLFEARALAGEARPADDETAEVRWVSLDDALAMEISPATRHMLESVRARSAYDD